MNSIFRNLPHKEVKRKRDKIGHFRIVPTRKAIRYRVNTYPICDAAFAPLQESRRTVRFCNIAAKRVE